MSSNPIIAPLISQLEANPGISQNIPAPTNQTLQNVHANSGLNQIRGTAIPTSTGAGIPKQVTNVRVSIANAQTGATAAVNVMFQRDPTDKAYGGVTVFVKGYQGNANPTQVAAGFSSPITFTLNNTGERIGFIVQAYGNSGNAPLAEAPTASATLQKSTAGGAGITTVTGYNPNFPPPTSLPVGLPGDIVRYNVNGDNTWDAVQYPAFFNGVFANYVNVSQAIGLYANIAPGGVSGEAVLGNPPTLAHPFNTTTYSLNVASTNTTIGLQHAENGNNGLFHVRGFWRMSHKLLINAVTNSRYYWGLSVWANGSSLGNNGAQPLGTTAYATDTPNKTTVGWRWSSGTDVNFKCIVIQAGASPTTVIVDSGVVVDSNLHTFDVTLDPGNTTYTFYIDGKQVGTIAATTLTFTPTNPSDALSLMFFGGDGKNTSTNIWFTFANMFLSLRQ